MQLKHYQINTKKLFLSIGVFLLSVFIINFANAQSIDTLKDQIEKTNQEKAKIEAEIEQYKKELNTIGAEKDTLANKIKSLEVTAKKLSADISLTQKKIQSANLTISELEDEISNTEKSIGENYNVIGKTIRDIHFTENSSLIEVLLTNISISEAWTEIGTLSQLQDGLTKRIKDLSSIKDSYKVQVTEYQNTKKDLVVLQNELGDQKKVVDVNKNTQNSLLTQTKNKESEYKKLLEEKEALKEKFDQEIFEYESQIQYLLDKSKLPSVGSGVLFWPLDNIYVTQKFGVTSDSGRLYKSGTHNGVDFRAAVGTRVLAARSGTVIGTGNTDAQPGCYSYGKWVLIEHTNGLTTLYAHLSVISVSKGQSVSTGDIIGYSGETGYALGPHLHFTVLASDGVTVQKYTASSYCKKVDIPLANTKAYLDPLLYL